MTVKREKKIIYCFDANAFIYLGFIENHIIKLPKGLWDHLAEMMADGKIISHKIVFDEICYKGGKSDFVSQWLQGKENSFIGTSATQISKVPEILKNFPDLIDPSREREQADPWLVALALEKANEGNLFYINMPIVVTHENKQSNKKIPAACKHFGISCQSLRDFFHENDITISLTNN